MAKRENFGRPKVAEDKRLITTHFRRTKEQGEKLDALGGAAWIRAQIDFAPWPRGTKPK